MGRWRSRHERPSREERERLGREAVSLFTDIARERSWLPFWEFDDLDYKECLFFPGNPGLSEPLTLSFCIGSAAYRFEDGDGASFPLDEDGRARFRAALDAAVKSRSGEAPP